MRFFRFLASFACFVVVLTDVPARTQELTQLRRRAREIEGEVSAIRELAFKWPIDVAVQSPSDFKAYAERQMERQFTAAEWENYDPVIRKLGLYSGGAVLDRSLVLSFLQAGALAYYDPDTDRFYILKENLPAGLLDVVLAHELSHGLQDQHFDLNRYLPAHADSLNTDEQLARQAVGEGDATYVETIWYLYSRTGRMPVRGLLRSMIRDQLVFDAETLRNNMKQLAQLQGSSPQALQTIDKLPDFMVLQQAVVYAYGMNFVHEIQRDGWSAVNRLYAEPPVSTEQILHPGKWIDREEPDRFTWPPFQEEDLFDDWNLLDVDTIGELTWRIIFADFDMDVRGESAAEGWNGDRYAVFRSKDGRNLLLLLYTSWDTEDDADDFADAYRELLTLKYPSDSGSIAVSQDGRDVLILECDEWVDSNAILAFMGRIRTWEREAIVRVDFDASGRVDFGDFLLFARHFGRQEGTTGFDPMFDLNRDGRINFPDFLTFARHFGKSVS